MMKSVRLYKAVSLVVVFFIAAVTLYLIDPIAQDLAYHRFSDCRSMFGIPHFMDVISNIPFIVVGYLGVRLVQKSYKKYTATYFVMLFVLFSGVFLTGLGSMFYHCSPNNFTLIFDRLPMTFVFTSLFALIISDYVDRRVGAWVFYLFLTIGVYSIFYWYYTEIIGVGDLRLYAFVQFFPIVCTPLILAVYRNDKLYTKELIYVFAAYIVAKLFEHFDVLIYNFTGFISGHTIKHLISALAIYLMYKMICKNSKLLR
ncbi:MAG: ceramidase domain-containing protein [Vicingaceae bacterium]|nr:ceramidase domain-containing protein [Vicingaceae bacterium]